MAAGTDTVPGAAAVRGTSATEGRGFGRAGSRRNALLVDARIWPTHMLLGSGPARTSPRAPSPPSSPTKSWPSGPVQAAATVFVVDLVRLTLEGVGPPLAAPVPQANEDLVELPLTDQEG
jgi:hypothetical protein